MNICKHKWIPYAHQLWLHTTYTYTWCRCCRHRTFAVYIGCDVQKGVNWWRLAQCSQSPCYLLVCMCGSELHSLVQLDRVLSRDRFITYKRCSSFSSSVCVCVYERMYERVFVIHRVSECYECICAWVHVCLFVIHVSEWTFKRKHNTHPSTHRWCGWFDSVAIVWISLIDRTTQLAEQPTDQWISDNNIDDEQMCSVFLAT